jgi:hypothetical protein
LEVSLATQKSVLAMKNGIQVQNALVDLDHAQQVTDELHDVCHSFEAFLSVSLADLPPPPWGWFVCTILNTS